MIIPLPVGQWYGSIFHLKFAWGKKKIPPPWFFSLDNAGHEVEQGGYNTL